MHATNDRGLSTVSQRVRHMLTIFIDRRSRTFPAPIGLGRAQSSPAFSTGARGVRILCGVAHRRRNAGRERPAEEESPGGLRRTRASGPSLLPLAGLGALIAAAILFARMLPDDGESTTAAPNEPAHQPFSSVAEEAPPSAGGGAGRLYNRAPSDLAASYPPWMEALELARKADGIFSEAQEAKRTTDHAGFQAKGRAAKEAYDKAFTMTALWEEQLLESYGDRDRQVRVIVRERNRWIDRVRVLHKTTGR